jgi:hypothetical protein
VKPVTFSPIPGAIKESRDWRAVVAAARLTPISSTLHCGVQGKAPAGISILPSSVKLESTLGYGVDAKVDGNTCAENAVPAKRPAAASAASATARYEIEMVGIGVALAAATTMSVWVVLCRLVAESTALMDTRKVPPIHERSHGLTITDETNPLSNATLVVDTVKNLSSHDEMYVGLICTHDQKYCKEAKFEEEVLALWATSSS